MLDPSRRGNGCPLLVCYPRIEVSTSQLPNGMQGINLTQGYSLRIEGLLEQVVRCILNDLKFILIVSYVTSFMFIEAFQDYHGEQETEQAHLLAFSLWPRYVLVQISKTFIFCAISSKVAATNNCQSSGLQTSFLWLHESPIIWSCDQKWKRVAAPLVRRATTFSLVVFAFEIARLTSIACVNHRQESSIITAHNKRGSSPSSIETCEWSEVPASMTDRADSRKMKTHITCLESKKKW